MEYLTPQEAADYLRVSRGTFYNYVSKGFIPFRIMVHTGVKKYVKEDLDEIFVKSTEITELNEQS